MRKSFFFLCVFAIIQCEVSFGSVFSQSRFQSKELPADTLATVGTTVISAKDFLERFELMPWPRKEQKARIEFTKLEFLYSLIAEKLMAMEASTQNIGTDSATMSMQYNLERMFVRDELYKREVLPKIEISGNELQIGMSRFAYELELEVLGILSEKEGELFYKKFKQSKNKKTALKLFKDSLYVPIDTITVNFGINDLVIEQAAYSIDKDSLSKPLESHLYGWIMLRLLKKYSNDQYVKLSKPDQLHKARQIISRRKEDSLAVKTFSSVTAPQRAEADPDLFYMLADTIYSILKSDSSLYRNKNVYYLPANVFDTLAVKFSMYLHKAFVTIDSGRPMTLEQVLLGLSNNYVVFPFVRQEYVRWVLNNNIKTVIQNELLSREGFRENLQQSENVRHDVAAWMDNRRSGLLLRRILDTVRVSEEEIEQEYQKDPTIYGATVLVKLREILVDSIGLAKELRERINRGEDFGKLARQYSKRKEWAKYGGESDFIDVSQWGMLGLFASSAKIGEVAGPWKIQDGLTIFTVLERKILDDSLRADFSETRQKIHQRILQQKRQKTLDHYIGTLAKKFNVTLNESNLRNVKTTTTSMMTWRHIGFGGRIVAVPSVVRQAEWVYEWLKQEQLNQ